MKNWDQKIENTEQILNGFFGFVKLMLSELKEEIKDFFSIISRNFFGKPKTRKIATIIFAFLIIIPAGFSYYKSWVWVYNYAYNWWYFDDNVKILENQYERSVRDFFHLYNKKYWTDCDWIKEVNVDMGMDRYWTDKKPWALCSLTPRMQIFPITVENPITDWTQKVRIWGKAIIVYVNGDKIELAWYQRYELWKKMEWSNDKWKFNPFSQTDKERFK